MLGTKYDTEHVSVKMNILETAMQLYGYNITDQIDGKDTINGVIAAARQLEGYVFSEFNPVASITPEQSDEENRRAFLASLDSTGCGCGRDNCNGSEQTCQC